MAENNKTEQDKNVPKGFSSFIDWAAMWLGIPAAIYAASKTDALTTAKQFFEEVVEQGKDVYERNRAAYKMAAIKPLTQALFVTAGLLVALVVIIGFAYSTVLGGAFYGGIVGILLLALMLFAMAFRLPPVPKYKKTADGGYEVYPNTFMLDGEEIEHPQKGMRIAENKSEIDLEKVSVLKVIAAISISGYVSGALFMMIGAFGRSLFPVVVGLVLLVVTRKATRLVVRSIAWAVEKSGDFIETAAGKLRLHLSVIEAGTTYENAKKGPMELFNQRMPWTAFDETERSVSFALLVMALFLIPVPTPEVFKITGIFVLFFWVVTMLLQLIGDHERVVQRRIITVRMLEKRAALFAFIIVPLSVLFPEEMKRLAASIDNSIKALFRLDVCDYIGRDGAYYSTAYLLVALTLCAIIGYVWYRLVTGISKVREKNTEAWRQTSRFVVPVIGLAFAASLCWMVVSGLSILAVQRGSTICKADTEIGLMAAQVKELAKANASQTEAMASKSQATDTGLTEGDSAKTKEPTVTPVPEKIESAVEVIRKQVVSQRVPSVAPQGKPQNPPPSEPASDVSATPVAPPTVVAQLTTSSSDCVGCTDAFARALAARRARQSKSQ